MNARAGKLIRALCILILSLGPAETALGQEAAATVSGTVKTDTGAAVANASVEVKNSVTEKLEKTQTGPDGRWTVTNLAPGDYEITVKAEGYGTNMVKMTVAAGASKTADVTMSGAPSLVDLGFAPGQTQGNAEDQARLNKRSHMLMLHQRYGLIATIPLIASLATSIGAGGHSTSSTDRYLHMALGGATGDLYAISAYYAIRAPKIPDTPTRGSIRLHKVLAWIHGPGMIMTPILGALAADQKSKGEKSHGIAAAHGPVAIVTAAAYGAAILSVSLKF